MLELVKRRPVAAIFALLWIASILPIWLPRLLPLGDLPDHVAAIANWHHLGDARFGLDRFYLSHHSLGANAGYHLVAYILSFIFSAAVATKILLSLYAAALPASVMFLARRFDRSPLLGFLVFPFIWAHPLGFGLIGTSMGWASLIFSLALLDRFLESPSLATGSALFGAAFATLLFHPLPHLLLLLCALPALLARLSRDRKFLIANAIACALLAATALLGYLAIRRAGGTLTVDGTHEALLEKAANVPHHLLIGWPGDADDYTLLLIALSWVLLAVTARTDERRAASTLRGWIPELCFLFCGIGYLALPTTLTRPFSVDHFGQRMLIPAALFGALLVRGPIAGRRRWLLVPAVLGALSFPIGLAIRFADFNTRARPAITLLERVPPGSSTLTLLVGGSEDPAVDADLAPYAGFHAYAQALAGGFDPYRADLGPLRARPEAALLAPPRDRPTGVTPVIAGTYDFVLTHGEARDFQLLPRTATITAHEGTWRLYATKGLK
jgi:hypothetical protein